MKTPKIHLLATMVPFAVLLLSHCTPIGGSHSQTATARASPTHLRVQVSSRPAVAYPFGILEEIRVDDSENEAFGMFPFDLPFVEPEGSAAVQIAPLVVTDSLLPDNYLQEWPADVMEAELRSAWISIGTSDPSPHHPTEDSVSEWTRSLR